ncbi:hypothetical protein DCS_04726 [Drechmeria coniospora]|uniref:Uncharacterized protein n=1 Tax=Drechmeria coniospora TaxID=98403 RepID=A0A151GKR6_DRECN|nr:hypothetical protein DCS_04726 [Drechmeria coniospora]KYK57713.1 hypothetical protein DCS_04726 [Drechmeria coniospora]ODA79603.1 hypothetical protein RJ55_05197 [Drechmeria coniospora]
MPKLHTILPPVPTPACPIPAVIADELATFEMAAIPSLASQAETHPLWFQARNVDVMDKNGIIIGKASDGRDANGEEQDGQGSTPEAKFRNLAGAILFFEGAWSRQ